MMEFTYQGLVRHGYGFYNPNHAAAAIVMLLPFVWYFRRLEISNRWPRNTMLGVSILLEVLLYLGLAFTFSRSGYIAFLVSAGVWWGLTRTAFSDSSKRKPYPYYKVKRIVFFMVLVGLSIYAGTGQRLVASDSSSVKAATNRFAIWAGGFKLLACEPFGTGAGTSGKIVSLLFTEGHLALTRTLVNSFLTFLVEHGLIFGLIPVFLLLTALFGLFAKWREAREDNNTFRCNTSALFLSLLTAAAISGLSSTCFDANMFIRPAGTFYGVLNDMLQMGFCIFLGVILIVSIVYSCFGYQNMRKRDAFINSAFFAAAVTVVIGLIAISAGKALYRLETVVTAPKISVVQDEYDNVWIQMGGGGACNDAEKRARSWIGVPDDKTDVSTLKQRLLELAGSDSIRLPLEKLNSIDSVINGIPESTNVVLFGKSCRFAANSSHRNVMLFNPDYLLPVKDLDTVKGVYLSRWDERGDNKGWADLINRCFYTINYFE